MTRGVKFRHFCVTSFVDGPIPAAMAKGMALGAATVICLSILPFHMTVSAITTAGV